LLLINILSYLVVFGLALHTTFGVSLVADLRAVIRPKGKDNWA